MGTPRAQEYTEFVLISQAIFGKTEGKRLSFFYIQRRPAENLSAPSTASLSETRQFRRGEASLPAGCG